MCIFAQHFDSKFMQSYLTIANDKEFFQLRSNKIIFVASDGNYSTIHMFDGHEHLVTLQLGKIEELLSEQLGPEAEVFVRIGRSLIVNMDYIYYINPAKKQLILSDSDQVWIERIVSADALKSLKSFMEEKFCAKLDERDK